MKYLFCYFVGNMPEEETVHFAVSSDGYNFEALNHLNPRHGSILHITDAEYEKLIFVTPVV